MDPTRIPDAWVQHCIRHGVRTSIPWHGGAERWGHRYMLWGLHVDTEPWTDPPQVWRVRWHTTTRGAVEACAGMYARALQA